MLTRGLNLQNVSSSQANKCSFSFKNLSLPKGQLIITVSAYLKHFLTIFWRSHVF